MALEALARALFAAAVEAVQPAHLFEAPGLLGPVEATRGDVRVIAVGKAGSGMWAAFAARLRRPVAEALVIVPHGHPTDALQGARVIEAGHPTPDAGSLAAADAVLSLAQQSAEDDALVVLLSGGSSALLGAPLPGLALDDVRAATATLLASGAPIDEVNAVRGRLTRVSAGRLAAASAAPVFTFALSDVPGDDPRVIGGGPTVHDPTGPERALAALEAYGLRDTLPAAVVTTIERGAPVLPPRVHCSYQLVGTNVRALEAASEAARAHGYDVRRFPGMLTGEAREVGAAFAHRLRALPAGTVLVAGGETTVTLGANSGRGGRNQEAALSAALALEEAAIPGAILFGGTDGRDGPTAAAGAIVTATTAAAIRSSGFDPDVALATHDSYRALDATDALLRTGPTGTNVMDVAFAIAGT